jgi:Protein of unknown function (DUF5818)
MRPVPLFKRDLFRDLSLGIAMSAMVFVCALAWGNPFLLTSSPAAPAPAETGAQQTTFQGTVLRDGGQFLLRQSSGRVYKLDDDNAQPFEGRLVKVSGTLDPGAQLIHVERIELVAA